MGMESFGGVPSKKEIEEQITPEVMNESHDKFLEEARRQAEYWNEAIKGYQAKIEEYEKATEDDNGNIVDKTVGHTTTKREGIQGMKKLIEEAEIAKEKEEAKFMSKLE